MAAWMPGTCLIPVRLVSAANLREHWAARHRRVAQERRTVGLLLRATWGRCPPDLPAALTISLMRVAPRAAAHPLDGDNLQSACKGTRDAVAAWLGREDGDPALTWVYGQQAGPYGVEITVEATDV